MTHRRTGLIALVIREDVRSGIPAVGTSFQTNTIAKVRLAHEYMFNILIRVLLLIGNCSGLVYFWPEVK